MIATNRNPLHRRTAAVAAAFVVAALHVNPIAAVTSRTWKQRDRSDFEQGEPQGVALSADGPIRLGSLLEALYEPDQPYVWSIAADGKGAVYAACGNEGVVYRIEPGGRATSFMQLDEAQVQALAVDSAGSIYAGTAPGGRVYKFSRDGKRLWVTDTGEKYVWALAFDGRGTLFAATGTEGRVLRFDGDGKSHVHFDSAETHIRTLAVDAQGALLAGSDGHGLIFRITAEGRGTVLYDAPLTEVTAIAPAPDGTIFAAVTGEAGGRPSRPPQARPNQPPSAPTDGGEATQAPPPPPEGAQQGAPPEQRVAIAMEGKVLAISPDGYGREVWSAGQEAILSLARLHDGSLVMGSGSQGRLYLLDARGGVSEIARSTSSQVTALLRRPATAGRGDEVIVAGSNLGSVAVLKPGYADKGQFESKVLDAQSFATWGRVAWRAALPSGTAVTLQVRSGNTEDPDRTWSDWSKDLSDALGSPIDSPAARFLQWRALLKTSDPAHTPELREVDVVYMQRNLPPEFRKIEVLPSGVSLQELPPAPPPSGQEAKTAGGDSEGVRHRPRPQSRRGFDPGARSITWQVVDPNDDDLFYDVQFRAADETAWKSIRSRIDEDFVTFDGAALPDGTYLVRVVASDAASNPPGQALTAEKISPPFDIDNTPPRIDRLKAHLDKGTLRVSFSAADGFSPLREATYSIDAGDWALAQAADGLNDSLSEEYEIAVPAPASGEHSVVVRVSDAAGNVGSGRTVVEIP